MSDDEKMPEGWKKLETLSVVVPDEIYFKVKNSLELMKEMAECLGTARHVMKDIPSDEYQTLYKMYDDVLTKFKEWK